MKVTEHQIIKTGEKDLIDAITAELNWETIETVFMKEHKLKIEDNVEYKSGDIVIHDNRIAYKLQFDVSVLLSVLLDREGNYLGISTLKNPVPVDGDTAAKSSGEPGTRSDPPQQPGDSLPIELELATLADEERPASDFRDPVDRQSAPSAAASPPEEGALRSEDELQPETL